MKKIITLLTLVLYVSAKAQTISTYAGNGLTGFSGDGGQATLAKLKNPTGVAVDAQGNLYISDSYNLRIRKVEAATGIISTVVGTGSYGFSGDGGLATAAKLTYPTDVAVDSQGNLYIANDYRIRKVTASTGIINTIAGNGNSTPNGDGGLATAAQIQDGQMTFDAQDNLYISSGHRIRKITSSTGIITTVVGTGTAGYSGDGGIATAAELYGTGGVVVDSNGNIYVSDQGNRRVRKVDASTGIITTIVNQLGSNSYFGDGGAATAAGVTGPNGLVLDAQNNLYIADQNNHRIRKVDALTGIITTIAGNGNGNYSGDGGTPLAAEMYFPADLAIDSQSNIYITEGYSFFTPEGYRVRKISNGTTGINQLSKSNVQVTIFPNPSNGIFNISSSAKFSEVKILNLLGETILNKVTDSESTHIDLSAYPKGVYFYQVIEKNNVMATGKLILQ
jgi:sugar lactone lactonase YvrE